MVSGPPKIQSYWLMLIATVITISIVSASQLITQRISLLLDRQASELLAADLVLVSTHPLDNKYERQAKESGLQVAHTVSFRTAIFVDDSPQLVELKAVDSNYPLRGQLKYSREVTADKIKVQQGPEPGEIWLDPKLSQLIDSSIALGSSEFEARWLLSYEPDRGGALFNLAPRILMNLDDLASTGLIVPGSRVKYRLLIAGEQNQLASFIQWLRPRLSENEKIQDLENARPEMRRALDQTRKFFALAIVLTLVIAMVAIAITARYTASCEAPKVAMLRAFGISQKRLFKFYSWQLAKVWVIAAFIGIGIGWLSQFPLQWALDGWFGQTLPQVWVIRPYLVAALVGFISLAGFCLPFLLIVIQTPPMQVIRHVSSRQSLRRGLLLAGSAIITVFLVLMILMQDSMLAVMTLSLLMIVALVLPLIFALMIKSLLYSSKRNFWLRQYLLSRLNSSTRGALFVMSAFSLALLAILMIAVVKDDLLTSWRTQLPDDIPNYFLFNIPSDEVSAVERYFEQRQIRSSTAYPLVRTRLTHINGKIVNAMNFTDHRATHFATHTFNVSYAEKLPDENKIVTGEWIQQNGEPQLSIEQGMANTLQLNIGDILSFSIGSETMEAPVTSIRSVLWENFRPNFYVITNQKLIEDLPQTWLMSALINSGQISDLKQLVSNHPSVTLLDITELMERIRGIVGRASIALEFFFIFALVSAIVVLLASIQTGKKERQMESALLRAMSAKTSQLYKVNVFEFSLMGLLIGLFAAIFASILGWIISAYFFNIDYHFSPAIWVYSLISATSILTIAGTLVSRKVYNISPMKILRT
ncbi:MAG: FtsX-like permease family protein [Gammaproteobacteria bacterium]|nr:MAG: FtsX-like permease family protein [Gammaproteobacteria bacterium]